VLLPRIGLRPTPLTRSTKAEQAPSNSLPDHAGGAEQADFYRILPAPLRVQAATRLIDEHSPRGPRHPRGRAQTAL